jgi:hypothetical protein
MRIRNTVSYLQISLPLPKLGPLAPLEHPGQCEPLLTYSNEVAIAIEHFVLSLPKLLFCLTKRPAFTHRYSTTRDVTFISWSDSKR